jgi:hypothetical protein
MGASQPVVGCTGVLVHATRGEHGPGEALVAIRGSREAYTAFSDEPMPVGQAVLVVGDRGQRRVDVVAWTSPTGAAPPGDAPHPG